MAQLNSGEITVEPAVAATFGVLIDSLYRREIPTSEGRVILQPSKKIFTICSKHISDTPLYLIKYASLG